MNASDAKRQPSTRHGDSLHVSGAGSSLNVESELQLKERAIAASLNAVAIADLQGRLTHINPAFLQLWGYSRDEEVLGRPATEFWMDPDAAAGVVKTLLAEGRWSGDLAAKHRDGTWFMAEVSAVTLSCDDQPRPTHLMAWFSDVTDRRRLADQDAKRLDKLRMLSEWGIALTGEPGDIFESVNQLVGQLFEVRFVALADIEGEDLYLKAVCVDGRIRRGNIRYDVLDTPCATVKKSCDVRVYDRVAERFPKVSFLREFNACSYCGIPIMDGDRRAVAVLCLLHDEPRTFSSEDIEILRLIAGRMAAEWERERVWSRQQQAEQDASELRGQLAHACRLSVMGEMAAGIAHELNQPLAAIQLYGEGCLQALNRDALSQQELQSKLQDIASLADRCGQIIHRLRQFVIRREPSCSTHDLREIIRTVLTLLNHEARRASISWSADMPEYPVWVNVNAIQVQQVLLNLIRNALEAQEPAGDGKCQIDIVACRQGDMAEVSVRDYGPGVTPEAMQRMFEPFFTTKPTGMGMGLKISDSIVRAHKGTLTCRNEPDGGARFTIRLPCKLEPEE